MRIPWICLLIMSTAMTANAQPQRLKVAIVGARTPEGFSISERIEASVKDVRKALADKKYANRFEVTDSVEMADIILEVSFSGRVPDGGTLIHTSPLDGRTPVLATATMVNALQVQLKLEPKADAVTTFEYSGGFWGVMAQRIVQNFAAWTMANAQALSRRTANQPGSETATP